MLCLGNEFDAFMWHPEETAYETDDERVRCSDPKNVFQQGHMEFKGEKPKTSRRKKLLKYLAQHS